MDTQKQQEARVYIQNLCISMDNEPVVGLFFIGVINVIIMYTASVSIIYIYMIICTHMHTCKCASYEAHQA